MTEAEFIQVHNPSQPGNINFPLQINVNMQTQIPQPGFSARPEEYITGLTVTTNAKYVEQEYNVPIFEILQQVEKIRFTFDNKQYNLKVVNRILFPNNDPGIADTAGTSGTGYSMFYFGVIPFLLPINYSSNVLPKSQEDVVVDFSPFITDLQFALNDYNVILNSIQEQRVSEIIVEATRTQRQPIPDNFLPIISGSALKAPVQDSNYSTIGWRTSRYDGTKSTPDNYSGVSPSLSGRSFIGEIYPEGANTEIVCNINNELRVYEELFHTGKTPIPQFTTTSIQAVLQDNISTTDTTLKLSGSIAQEVSIDTGDILILNQVEKVRVLQADLTKNPPEVKVQRGYAGASTSSHNGGDPIDKIQRIDIFRFGITDTRITSAVNSTIYIKDSNEILYTEGFGTVFTSSLCPP